MCIWHLKVNISFLIHCYYLLDVLITPARVWDTMEHVQEHSIVKLGSTVMQEYAEIIRK